MNIKEIIGSRIKSCRKVLGLTTKELAERIGTLSSSRISNWEQGTRSPGPNEAKLLSEHLEVSASYLLGLTDNPHGELSYGVINHIRHIPLLNMKEAASMSELLQSDAIAKNEKTIVVDMFNPSLNSNSLFGVLVEDNSMQPDFQIGTIVVIDGDKQPKPGDFVLVNLFSKNQVLLRKFGEVEGCLFQLIPSNDLWASNNIKQKEEVEILGIATEIRISLK
jgi:SOS-response transcriptional repressor LexA